MEKTKKTISKDLIFIRNAHSRSTILAGSFFLLFGLGIFLAYWSFKEVPFMFGDLVLWKEGFIIFLFISLFFGLLGILLLLIGIITWAVRTHKSKEVLCASNSNKGKLSASICVPLLIFCAFPIVGGLSTSFCKLPKVTGETSIAYLSNEKYSLLDGVQFVVDDQKIADFLHENTYNDPDGSWKMQTFYYGCTYNYKDEGRELIRVVSNDSSSLTLEFLIPINADNNIFDESWAVHYVPQTKAVTFEAPVTATTEERANWVDGDNNHHTTPPMDIEKCVKNSHDEWYSSWNQLNHLFISQYHFYTIGFPDGILDTYSTAIGVIAKPNPDKQ